MITFIEFVKRQNCSIRVFNVISRYGIDENTSCEDIVKIRSVGKRTLPEILELQRLYKSLTIIQITLLT